MRIIQILFIFCVIPILSVAQQVNVRGVVTDSETGEFLIASHIFDVASNQGCISNEYGYYNIFVGKGDTVELHCSFVGYNRKLIRQIVNSDLVINISLDPDTHLEEVVIFGRKKKTIVNSPQRSRTDIPIMTIK